MSTGRDPTAELVDVVSHEVLGDGFLRLHRTRLVNRRPGQPLSVPYPCDFVTRPVGQHAVVVAVWREVPAAKVEVLLRHGLRPPLALSAPPPTAASPTAMPMAVPMAPMWSCEVVAGILERGEDDEAAIRRRAQLELYEEAGFEVSDSALVRLGAASYSSPGLIAERLHFFAANVTGFAQVSPPPGDGSPMEEGARLEWMELDSALAACLAGAIEDCKTELALRRLRDCLRSST